MSKTTDKNWQRVREIFDEALQKTPEARQKFVQKACGRNKSLRAEVESLLSSLDSADSFLETPAVVKVAGEVLSKDNQFKSGQNLGHYEIVEKIGSGGMGEVYLAKDTKLNRRVAIKVLRENLLSDEQANRRLLREARAAALLEHPNICAIYEISETADCSFIVMQFAEGETLAAILKKKSLSIKRALDLAIQIADALTEAHSQGIIHRDIKPANIIVNDKNQAKILDFGLAKFVESESNTETTQRLNSSGAVMGTVPFMSPEQLRGKRLDARTDIFSFGAVLYEMLSARQAFARENNAETISAILNDEPDLSLIPSAFQPILQKALAKNKNSRYESAQILAEDLRGLQKSGDFGEIPPDISTLPTEQVETDEPKMRQFYFWQSSGKKVQTAPMTAEIESGKVPEIKRNWFQILSIPLILIAFGAAGFFYWRFKSSDYANNFDALRSSRLVSWKSAASSNYSDFRVSNSGKMIAFSSSQDGKTETIYVKQPPDGEDIRVIKDTWTNYSPIWSPDDQRIAFVSAREGVAGIYESPSFGGTANLLKIIGKGDLSLRNWTADGTAIFYEYDGNLFRLELTTRESTPITNFAKSPANGRHFDLSPDEKQIAFLDEHEGQIDLWAMPLKGGEPVRLTADAEKEIRLLWHADGKRILYNAVRDNEIQIYLAFTDGRAPMQVTRGDGYYELADISRDGEKVFYWFWQGNSDIFGVRTETGEEFELASEIQSELWADVSPDGSRVVFQSNNSPRLTPNIAKSSLIIKPLENASAPPLVLKGHSPHFLPDSRRVAFLRLNREEMKYQYWLVNAASGEEKQLTVEGVSPPAHSRLPINREDTGKNFSPDASRFVFLDSKKQNIWMASVDAAETSNLTDNTNPNVRYHPPVWSPDGKRITFLSSDETGSPKTSLRLYEQGNLKEIYSTTGSLHLLGFSASGNEILLAMTDGIMRSTPLEVKLLQVSITGESRILNVFKDIYAWSLTLSDDGKRLAFTARRDERDNIWMAAVSGGEPKKLTANSHHRIFYGSPAWSADGKAIFFDKQDQINTISMFENFK